MASLTMYVNRELQDIDAVALDVISGNAVALTDGTTYRVQNTAFDSEGRRVGSHHYACLVQTSAEPAVVAQLKRALTGASIMHPNGEPVYYTPASGESGYIWSPYGDVSISINPTE